MTNDEVIGCLNNLVETSKDSEEGFRASAQQAHDPQVMHLFRRQADECREAVAELQAMVRDRGGRAEDGSMVAGAPQRGWAAVRSNLAGDTDLAVLDDVERGEGKAVADYRAALGEELPPGVRTVVERQFQGVKRHHDEVRTLRDRTRNGAP